ncbi:MAG: LemA family protein, partial [Armatimonadota bacterium]|nr:LemA family protein [Armatimonadota bacterium]
LADSLPRAVESARTAGSLADRVAAEERLEAELHTLLSALGTDPRVSATEMFQRLSDEIAGTENRIAVERKRYNEAVAAYARTARSFPTVLVRPLLGFPPTQPLFEAATRSGER